MHKLRDTWRAWLVEKRVGPTNEPLPEDPDGPTSRRDTLWYRLQGEDYLALALRACAAVVPLSELVINEYDLEFVGDRFERKRSAMLNMVYKLKRLNAPLHAIGLQAHLRGERTIDRRGLQSLLTELKAMGLGVVISELDVMDYALPVDIPTRDAIVADRADALLDAVYETMVPRSVLTWGLTDRHVWVPEYFKRKDGAANRPLPLDDQFQPKPLMRVLERYRARY